MDTEYDDIEGDNLMEEERREQPAQAWSSPVGVALKNPSGLGKMLDNPSIQAYPQHHTQVNLQLVQNLSTVFKDLYEDRSVGDKEEGTETLNRRPKRPRPSYVGLV